MQILLAISALVLTAILWAGISILRHIRLGKRRNNLLRRREHAEQETTMQAMRSSAVTPLPARFAAPVLIPEAVARIPQPEPRGVPYAAPVLVQEAVASIPQPESRGVPYAVPALHAETAATAAPSQATVRPMRPLTAMAAIARGASLHSAEQINSGESRQREKAPTTTPLRIVEVAQGVAARDVTASLPKLQPLAAVPAPRQSAAPPPPVVSVVPSADRGERRPVRSAPAPVPASQSSSRPGWDYFNKDMGDLSDPAPSRIRVRGR